MNDMDDLYIPGTSEYIWYVIVIHNVFYIKCYTEISNKSDTDIDNYLEQLCCHTYILSYKVNITEAT